MFQSPSLLRSSVAVFAIAAVLPSAPALAADLGPGVEHRAVRAGRPPPWLDRSFVDRWAEEDCRVVSRRQVNALGEEVVRRARICEEGSDVHRHARPPHRVAGDDWLGPDEFAPPADAPDEEGERR